MVEVGAPGAAAHAVAFCRACTCAFPVVLLVFLAAFTSLPGRYESHVVVRSYAGYLPYQLKDEPAVFGPRVPADGVTARLEEASPKEACEALTNKYEGRWIALVRRSFGTEKCDFVTKVRTRGCPAASGRSWCTGPFRAATWRSSEPAIRTSSPEVNNRGWRWLEP